MVRPKILILRVAGTNCDRETEWAFKLAGGDPERVHINMIKRGEKKIRDYRAIIIPGGFSYGDDISAGKVLANEIRHNLWEDINRFIEKGMPVIGICNGFQVLVKAGFLPLPGDQVVTLGWNDSARFEDRWVYLRVNKNSSPLLQGMPDIIRLPVAHAEGKFIPENNSIFMHIEKNNLIAFRYCDPEGNLVGYPYNPNGSMGNVAGITCPGGLVIGMMPHPERAILRYLYPDWNKNKRKSSDEFGDGFIFFKKIVEYIKSS